MPFTTITRGFGVIQAVRQKQPKQQSLSQDCLTCSQQPPRYTYIGYSNTGLQVRRPESPLPLHSLTGAALCKAAHQTLLRPTSSTRRRRTGCCRSTSSRRAARAAASAAGAAAASAFPAPPALATMHITAPLRLCCWLAAVNRDTQMMSSACIQNRLAVSQAALPVTRGLRGAQRPSPWWHPYARALQSSPWYSIRHPGVALRSACRYALCRATMLFKRARCPHLQLHTLLPNRGEQASLPSGLACESTAWLCKGQQLRRRQYLEHCFLPTPAAWRSRC